MQRGNHSDAAAGEAATESMPEASSAVHGTDAGSAAPSDGSTRDDTADAATAPSPRVATPAGPGSEQVVAAVGIADKAMAVQQLPGKRRHADAAMASSKARRVKRARVQRLVSQGDGSISSSEDDLVMDDEGLDEDTPAGYDAVAALSQPLTMPSAAQLVRGRSHAAVLGAPSRRTARAPKPPKPRGRRVSADVAPANPSAASASSAAAESAGSQAPKQSLLHRLLEKGAVSAGETLYFQFFSHTFTASISETGDVLDERFGRFTSTSTWCGTAALSADSKVRRFAGPDYAKVKRDNQYISLNALARQLGFERRKRNTRSAGAPPAAGAVSVSTPGSGSLAASIAAPSGFAATVYGLDRLPKPADGIRSLLSVSTASAEAGSSAHTASSAFLAPAKKRVAVSTEQQQQQQPCP